MAKLVAGELRRHSRCANAQMGQKRKNAFS
jgi:hypothetical protein